MGAAHLNGLFGLQLGQMSKFSIETSSIQTNTLKYTYSVNFVIISLKITILYFKNRYAQIWACAPF